MHRWLILALAAAACAEPAETNSSTTTTPEPPPEPEPLNLSAADAPFELQADAAFYQDVPYGDDERQVFDLFVPEGEGPFPVVMEVHGGGFVAGDEDSIYLFEGGQADIEETLAEGFAFLNVEYRVLDAIDDTGVIKSLGDVRYALQYVRWHHEELGIDPTRIVGRGTSAGAGTVTWLAVHDDMADPEADDPVQWQSTRLSAAYAYETQASYDMVRWETHVFEEYGITLQFAAEIGLEQTLLSFYGAEALSEFYREPILSYRADVDMMGLMSADDPPLRIENEIELNDYPVTIGRLYHHPNHAFFAAQAGIDAGVDVQAVIPRLDIDDSDGETHNEFLFRHL